MEMRVWGGGGGGGVGWWGGGNFISIRLGCCRCSGPEYIYKYMYTHAMSKKTSEAANVGFVTGLVQIFDSHRDPHQNEREREGGGKRGRLLLPPKNPQTHESKHCTPLRPRVALQRVYSRDEHAPLLLLLLLLSLKRHERDSGVVCVFSTAVPGTKLFARGVRWTLEPIS